VSHRARDGHAVVPVGAQGWQVIAPTGLIDRLFVEIAVLYKKVSLKECAQILNCIVEGGLPFDGLLVDPMEVDVEVFELDFRVNQEADRMDEASVGNEGKAKLADAGCVGVGGFDVNSNEPIRPAQDILFLGGRGRSLRLCGGGLSSTKQVFEKVHIRGLSIRDHERLDILPVVARQLNVGRRSAA